MSDATKIQWSEATWNVVTGCTKVSDGCVNCYITGTPPFRIAGRKFDKPGIGGTTGIVLHEDRLTLPLKWRKPRKIFVNSLSDLFHDQVPDELIAKVFAVMALTQQHTYQLLTKRPARMRSLLCSDEFRTQVARRAVEMAEASPGPPYLPEHLVVTHGRSWWPLLNVHLGVSAENQQWADTRIPILCQTPAAVRFVSAEPLLGPINLHHGHTHCPTHDFSGGFCTGLCPDRVMPDWLICGGESGKGARPMELDWARDLVGQCRDAGIAPFVKQLGTAWARDMRSVFTTVDRKGGDMQYWPADLRVREFPRQAAAVAS